MALTGKKKADFLRRMRLGRLRKARGTTPKRRKAPAKRKAAARKPAARKPATRRATARKPAARRAPARRRSSARPEGVIAALAGNAIPSVVGIVLSGLTARAIPAANTPAKKAAVTGAAAVALAMASRFVARNVPLGVVNAGFVKAMAGGMAVDAVFRGTSTIRSNIQSLPEAARRSGGLLAGRPGGHSSSPVRPASSGWDAVANAQRRSK